MADAGQNLQQAFSCHEKGACRAIPGAPPPSLLPFVSMKAGLLSSPCVRSLTPQCQLPGERCRVKRLSKFTGVNIGLAHGA